MRLTKGRTNSVGISRNIELAESIIRKLRELHINDDLAGQLGADLSDIVISSKKLERLLTEFFKTPTSETERLAELASELEREAAHVGWHIKGAKASISRLVKQLYNTVEK